MTVEPYRPGDLDRVHRLEREATGGNAGSLDALAAHLADPAVRCVVWPARRSPVRTLLGAAVAHRSRRDARLLVLDAVFVHPGHRRRGVGRGLLLYLAHHPAFASFAAAVPDDNLPAHLLLRACGVPCVRVVRRPDGDRYAFRLDHAPVPTLFDPDPHPPFIPPEPA